VAAILAGRSVISVEQDEEQCVIIKQRLQQLSGMLRNPAEYVWNLDKSTPSTVVITQPHLRRGKMVVSQLVGIPLAPVRERYEIEAQPTAEYEEALQTYNDGIELGKEAEERKQERASRKDTNLKKKLDKANVSGKSKPPSASSKHPKKQTSKNKGSSSSSSSLTMGDVMDATFTDQATAGGPDDVGGDSGGGEESGDEIPGGTKRKRTPTESDDEEDDEGDEGDKTSGATDPSSSQVDVGLGVGSAAGTSGEKPASLSAAAAAQKLADDALLPPVPTSPKSGTPLVAKEGISMPSPSRSTSTKKRKTNASPSKEKGKKDETPTQKKAREKREDAAAKKSEKQKEAAKLTPIEEGDDSVAHLF
jgi:hypothetical protein